MSHTQAKGILTAPSTDSIFCCGNSKEQQKDICVKKNIKSFLHLLPPEEEEGPLPADFNIDSSNTARVLVSKKAEERVPQVATDLIKALDELPRPTLVACNSGARATAAARIYLASKRGVGADATIANADDNEEKWQQAEPLREWVEKTLAEPQFVFRQLFDKESGTYTYLLGDNISKDAILIDPIDTMVDRDLAVVKALGLNVKVGLNTHAHADHVTGTAVLREQINAGEVAGFKSAISASSGAKADILIAPGDKVWFGARHVTARPTPGHTNGCMCYVLDDESMVFTGDTLLIKGCGRTDFQEGSSSTLYDSVHTQLFTLPTTCEVCPAHDYNGRTRSTIGEEIASNPRLGGGNSKEQFVQIMADLKLSNPKMIDIAVPKNMNCGV